MATINDREYDWSSIEVRTDDDSAGPVLLDLRVLIHDPLTIQPALVYWKRGDAAAAKTI